MTDFKVGTVAEVTTKGGWTGRAMRVPSSNRPWWVGADEYKSIIEDENIVDIRPLVVLDPENYDEVRNVVQYSNYLEPGALVRDLTKAMQRGLKAVAPKPPRLPGWYEIDDHGMVRVYWWNGSEFRIGPEAVKPVIGVDDRTMRIVRLDVSSQ